MRSGDFLAERSPEGGPGGLNLGKYRAAIPDSTSFHPGYMIYVVVRRVETGYQHLSGWVPLAVLVPCEVSVNVPHLASSACVPCGAAVRVNWMVSALVMLKL